MILHSSLLTVCIINYEKHLTIYNGKTESFLLLDGVIEPNNSTLTTTQGKELAGPVKTDEYGTKMKKILERTLVSFNGVKDDQNDHEQKAPEKLLKSVLPRLVPTVSFNDKVTSTIGAGSQSQRRKSTVIRLSFKRKSVDGEEINGICEYRLSLSK